MKKYKPFIDLGPGDIIKDELEYYGWNQKDLAEIMDRSEKNISQILTNKVPIVCGSASVKPNIKLNCKYFRQIVFVRIF